MRALLQRVSSSSVTVNSEIVGSIQHGWLVLLGVGQGDTLETAQYVADKCVHMRGFSDDDGKMNRNVLDVGGAMLIVSQFTLYGDCVRGRRPSFDRAAAPQIARELYEAFCDCVQSLGVRVERGVFQADMKVTLVNDGPVTLLIERDATPPPK